MFLFSVGGNCVHYARQRQPRLPKCRLMKKSCHRAHQLYWTWFSLIFVFVVRYSLCIAHFVAHCLCNGSCLRNFWWWWKIISNYCFTNIFCAKKLPATLWELMRFNIPDDISPHWESYYKSNICTTLSLIQFSCLDINFILSAFVAAAAQKHCLATCDIGGGYYINKLSIAYYKLQVVLCTRSNFDCFFVLCGNV